jgi:predicted XRE-type DNA-binding protein
MPHYTASDDAFVSKITFDFVAQLEHRLETSGINQSELAQKLNVSDSAVSQVLNCNRTNFHLKTLVQYARALGMKVAIVAYDDRDPLNENGPVGSEIFRCSWEKIGRPRDIFSVNEASYAANRCPYTISDWRYGWTNSTFEGLSSTLGELPHISRFEQPLPEKATTAHA